MKKILILGAGNAQVDLIEYCKENGYYVYGCSYTNTDKGIPLLDSFEQINIIDIEAVRDYAEKIEADIVYSVGSDIAMPTVARVCELLHLPQFVSYETALLCNTKDDMRQKLGNDFLGNVPHMVVERPEQLKEISFFPVIMKPVDSQGQRGVFEAHNYDELVENYERSMSYARKKRLIVEKYLEGQEISVNAFFVNGKAEFMLVSDRISFTEYPGGIIKKHLLPTQMSSTVVERATDLAYRVAKKLHIENGPAYYQMKVVEEMPYLIEVTPRLDGCHMWRLIKHYCGIDLLKTTMELLETGTCQKIMPSYQKEKFTLEFICQAPGTLMQKRECEKADYRRDYYKEGEEVRELNGYMEKCGYIIRRDN